MNTIEKLQNFEYNGEKIPARMHDAIARYVDEKIPPGGFLTAVLANNLMDSVGCADDENMRLLHVYCAFIYRKLPAGCHGSLGRVMDWVGKK